ncbi:ABC transporter permease [Brevibacillus laterosporus]|uniref:ABC transporter permease n=1 Tax=Brevibacillus laterosporus TaxID=1465 RepID=UPI0026503403|nr:ABC transporter permease subunit [Brevibacillus laterosporus]MDN9008695.1 ABC transporter permease subunit [Brevibacillus laterosporus]MDO0939781.1 ABC transporter permease subunit [Brevibacillus laterosporus]
MNKQKGRISLWLGFILVSALFIVAIFGPMIAPYDKDFQVKAEYVEINGSQVIVSPPLPPSEKYLIGTDKWGHDMLTILLYGARYTLFVTIACALLRVVLGVIIGLKIGMADRPQRWWTSLESAWGHVPVFLPVYFLLYRININSPLSSFDLAMIFIIVVSVLGTPSVVSSIRQKTEEVRKAHFVTAAISIGASKNHILLRHILPQIKEQVMMLFVIEITAVMALMGQLGIFNLFIGGTIEQFDQFDSSIFLTKTYEWAGLIGQSRSFLQTKQWIFFAPLTAFMLAVLGFTLIANAMKKRYEEVYNRAPYV